MTDAPLPPKLQRIKDEVKAEAIPASAQAWFFQAQRLAERVDDPAARWDLLLLAMRRVGWPDS